MCNLIFVSLVYVDIVDPCKLVCYLRISTGIQHAGCRTGSINSRHTLHGHTCISAVQLVPIGLEQHTLCEAKTHFLI